MTVWPKDTQAARNSFYGDPGRGQIASQMVPVVPPFAMYYEGKRVTTIEENSDARAKRDADYIKSLETRPGCALDCGDADGLCNDKPRARSKKPAASTR